MMVAHQQAKETMEPAGTGSWTSVSRTEKMNDHSLLHPPLVPHGGMPAYECRGHSAGAVLYDCNYLHGLLLSEDRTFPDGYFDGGAWAPGRREPILLVP